MLALLRDASMAPGHNGRAKLADFGLAKQTDETSSFKTEDGSILGTPAYMSPEQARGELKNVGPASDQYSLGIVLYEILTGRPPFVDSSHGIIATVAAVAGDDLPTDIRSQSRDVPKDLAAIGHKSIEKRSGDRYETVEQLASDLNNWLHGQPVLARPIKLPTRVTRWARRNPLTAGLVTTIALVVTIALVTISSLFGVATLARNRAGEEQKRAEQEAVLAKDASHRADTERSRAEAELSRAEAFNCRSSVRLALQEFHQQKSGSAKSFLERCPEDFRGWEWHVLNAQLLPEGQRLTGTFGDGGDGFIDAQALHPTKPQMAFSTENGGIWLINTEDGSTIRTLREPNAREDGTSDTRGYRRQVRHLFFNTTGTELIACNEAAAVIWSVGTNPRKMAEISSPHHFYDFAVAADLSHIAILESDGSGVTGARDFIFYERGADGGFTEKHRRKLSGPSLRVSYRLQSGVTSTITWLSSVQTGSDSWTRTFRLISFAHDTEQVQRFTLPPEVDLIAKDRLAIADFLSLAEPQQLVLGIDGGPLFVLEPNGADLKIVSRATIETGSGLKMGIGINTSRDGKRLFATSTAGIKVWSLPELNLLAELKDPSAGWGAAISPDGEHVANVDSSPVDGRRTLRMSKWRPSDYLPQVI